MVLLRLNIFSESGLVSFFTALLTYVQLLSGYLFPSPLRNLTVISRVRSGRRFN